MTTTTFIGIDPGSAGAIAVLDQTGQLISVVEMPTIGSEPLGDDVAGILDAADRIDRLFVTLEEPFAVPGMAASTKLAQGINYGKLLGVVETLQIRHQRIKPRDWKSTLGVPMSSKLKPAERKRNSREIASRLWPRHAHLWAKQSQDGIAEAALIGEAGRRMVMGK